MREWGKRRRKMKILKRKNINHQYGSIILWKIKLLLTLMENNVEVMIL